MEIGYRAVQKCDFNRFSCFTYLNYYDFLTTTKKI